MFSLKPFLSENVEKEGYYLNPSILEHRDLNRFLTKMEFSSVWNRNSGVFSWRSCFFEKCGESGGRCIWILERILHSIYAPSTDDFQSSIRSRRRRLMQGSIMRIENGIFIGAIWNQNKDVFKNHFSSKVGGGRKGTLGRESRGNESGFEFPISCETFSSKPYKFRQFLSTWILVTRLIRFPSSASRYHWPRKFLFPRWETPRETELFNV